MSTHNKFDTPRATENAITRVFFDVPSRMSAAEVVVVVCSVGVVLASVKGELVTD